ncbi:MAG: hypothetical protein J6K31_07195 [Parabacteroides sp.]|nr:hypothetical protein [Parabacteroides sp.]
MNKKFSTLVASVLLVGAMGTVNAANYAKFTKNPTAAELVKSGTYYQLETRTAGDVLGMFRNDKSGQYYLKVVKAATDSKDELRSTLWTIMSQENAEGGYSYVFVNYASGLQLAINSQGSAVVKHSETAGNIATPKSNITVGGDVAVWKWIPAPDPVSKKFTETTLSAAFGNNRDSVLVLTASSDKVGAEKYALKNLPTDLSSSSNLLKIKPASPAAIVLGADDLNSMLWKGDAVNGKLNLTFTPDVKNNQYKNVFTQPLRAESAVGYPFRNFKWELPEPGGSNTTTDADNAEDALGHHNNWYEKLNAYEISLHREAFVKAIKALRSTYKDDAIYAALKAFVNAKGTETEYDKVLAAVQAVEPTAEASKAIKPIVISYIKSEMPNFRNSANGMKEVMGYIVEVRDALASLDSKIASLDVAGKLVAANKEKESVRAKWDAQGWVSLKTDAGKYVMVDTAYMTTNAGQKYLKLSDDKTFVDLKTKSNGESMSPISWTREDINGRFNFQFVWYPAQDSIVIRSAGFATLADGVEATSVWKDLSLPESMVPAPTMKSKDGKLEANSNPAERNLVKIAVLANTSHRELTIGNSEYDRLMNPANTINTRISAGASSMYELTTLPSGVYFFNLSTGLASRKYDAGKYYVAKFCGNNGNDYEAEETTQLYGVAQDFGHMPRTQWVVKQNPGVAGQQTVSIYNREFPGIKYENVQLFKGGDKKIFAPFGIAGGDTLSYALAADVKPLAGVLTDSYLGYYKPEDENQFKLNRMTLDYFSGIQIGNFVNVAPTANDTTVRVDVKGDKATFQLVPSVDAKYGYEGSVAPQLYRRSYTIKVYDGNKLVNDSKWIARDAANENTYKVTANANEAVKFYLKENNQIVTEEGDTLCYHALVDFANGDRVGVRDGSLKFSIEGVCSEERVATFHVGYDESIIYRELKGNETTAVAEGVEPFSAPCVANFFRARIADKQYLFESANQSQFNEAGKGINYLGVRYQGGQFDDSTAIYVDTADVRNPYRPQYMLAVGTEIIKEGKYCPIHGFNADCKEEHLLDVPAQVWGRYLINAQDSLKNAVNGADYQWERQYTRLAFVHAMHTGDTLIIFKNGEYPLTKEGHKDYLKAIEWARAAVENTVTPNENDYVYVMNVKDRNGNNATKAFTQDYANYKFMFRLVDDKDTRDFIIENHDSEWSLHNDTYTATENANEYRAIKVQNGVPVIARFNSASEGILNAEWWNIDERCTTPTANEGIATSEVAVIAGEGNVTIAGAAGKKVVISNILGQVVANTVIASDNATIAVPQGVVVVAVEGEEAVKAIVK